MTVESARQQVLARLDALIAKGEAVLATHSPNPPNVIGFPTLGSDEFSEWATQSVAYLKNLFGESHTYTEAFASAVDREGYTGSAKKGLGVLRASREDVEGGYLRDVRALVSAEVFSDFLEMAQHLFETGYKDPAAMLTGAVLEDGLRRIAERHEVKAKTRDDLSALNQKCADAGVYNRLVQKRIQVWVDVRNKADHADFDGYTDTDVADMLRGVRDFLGERLT